MANICSNKIIFYGEREKVQALYDAVTAFYNPRQTNTLYNFALLLGMEEKDIPSCRGDFSYIEEIEFTSEDEVQFFVDVETAWSPVNEYWACICNYFGINYAASSEECGHGIFVIHNDPDGQFFPENYSIDIWDNNEYGIKSDVYFFKTAEEVMEFLNEEAEETFSYEEWKEIFEEEDFGAIREWERD